MPHIIVEHTADIQNIPALLEAMHDNLASQETITLESIKTRAISLDYAVVGTKGSSSMVHVTVRLLPGRSDELIQKITTDLHIVVKNNNAENTSVTVEAVLLHAESYKK